MDRCGPFYSRRRRGLDRGGFAVLWDCAVSRCRGVSVQNQVDDLIVLFHVHGEWRVVLAVLLEDLRHFRVKFEGAPGEGLLLPRTGRTELHPDPVCTHEGALTPTLVMQGELPFRVGHPPARSSQLRHEV